MFKRTCVRDLERITITLFLVTDSVDVYDVAVSKRRAAKIARRLNEFATVGDDLPLTVETREVAFLPVTEGGAE